MKLGWLVGIILVVGVVDKIGKLNFLEIVIIF